MTGRDALPRHYPAPARRTPRRGSGTAAGLLVALLLGGCATAPRVDLAPASEPLPLGADESGTPKPLDVRADDVLMHAAGLIGTRYRYGGQSPQTGFDCSGFTSWVFREAVGIQLPRTAREQFAGVGTPVPQHELKAGDLVFFRQSRRGIDHVGIYVGEGRFVHAPSRGGRVRIDALSLPHWQRTYQGARRLLGAP